jgi:hypothetical protein
MPWSYEIDPNRGFVRFRAWGVLTHEEITALRLRYTCEEAAGFSHFGPCTRRAFVATNPVPYAL